ncbi:VanW family protein [Neobacillus drentensis]|uniref:VanW family protein n=1 Tax=Neobacillus drentensis TaxID=220684 RepID=UPI001F3A5DFE|nr:VanW family protein [Neobacillus drentensis]ULT59058.1 VanW family protein [Neobacillus drentensis]
MKKITRIITILLAGCLIGLAGCSEQTTKEKEAHAAGPQNSPKEKQLKAEKKRKVEKPVFVNLIDPNTKRVIKTLKPKEMGYGSDDEKYKAQLAEVTRELARGTNDTPGYDKRMILDKLDENGQIIKGSPQTILEEEELTDKIIQASLKGGDVEIPLYVTASGYKPEEAAQLGEVVVASYTTHFNSGVAGRSKNIALSAEAIDHVILGAGDSFSFNTTVGPSDAEHGYQPAPEALDGKLVDGIGGGICQTSSTLYNAIDKLAVSYIEKHHHSLHVGYVPTGRDATVSYGGYDFRFKNTTGVPLMIKSTIRRGSLTVEIRTARVYQNLVKKS